MAKEKHYALPISVGILLGLIAAVIEAATATVTNPELCDQFCDLSPAAQIAIAIAVIAVNACFASAATLVVGNFSFFRCKPKNDDPISDVQLLHQL